MIFSKILRNMQVRAMGRNSEIKEEVVFLGMGKVKEVFHLVGVIPEVRHKLKRVVRQ